MGFSSPILDIIDCFLILEIYFRHLDTLSYDERMTLLTDFKLSHIYIYLQVRNKIEFSK